MEDADGWIRLVNICDENRESVVIVNTAARNNIGVGAYGGTLSNTLEELQRKLVTLWVINRQRDSLELLQDYVEAIPNSTVHVVKNAYFGADSKFELYNGSKTKKLVEGNGGRSLVFPGMADRVSDDLYSKRLSIGTALKDLPIGPRGIEALARGSREGFRRGRGRCLTARARFRRILKGCSGVRDGRGARAIATCPKGAWPAG